MRAKGNALVICVLRNERCTWYAMALKRQLTSLDKSQYKKAS